MDKVAVFMGAGVSKAFGFPLTKELLPRIRRELDKGTIFGRGRLRAVLVAPSLVRDVRDGNLLEIWKNALEFLRVAREWIIIGYSFLPEDIAIRSLFIRAYQGRPAPPRIRVVQKGDDETTRSRYKLFFPECAYQTDGLEEFLPRATARARPVATAPPPPAKTRRLA